MQNWMKEAQTQKERYRDFQRQAEQYASAVEHRRHDRRVLYSPLLAWIGRSLIGFGLRIHRKHGRRRLIVVAKPKLA